MRVWVVMLVGLASLADAQEEFNRTVAQAIGERPICVTWSKREFVYQVDEAGSEKTPGASEFTAIDAAFLTWQQASDGCSDFKFTRGARVTAPRVGNGTADTNVVVFRERACRDVVPLSHPCLSDGSCTNSFHCWDHSDSTIGLTTSTYSTRTGIVSDADIELNASEHVDQTAFLFTTISAPKCEDGAITPLCVATDVQNTMTHEIGHVVGLDHVENDTSTMAATAPLGETSKRVLDKGTQQGFCLTYPKQAPPVPCDELAQQRVRIKATARACSVAPFPAGVLLLAWGLRRRSPRRRYSLR